MNKVKNNHFLRNRIYAFGVDMIFITLFSKAISYSFMSYLKKYMLIDKVLMSQSVDLYFEQLTPIIMFTIFSTYFILGHYIGHGLTIGKAIFEIKIVSNTRDELDLMDSIMILFGYIISFLSFGLTLVPIHFFNNKCLIEILTRTTIVNIQTKTAQISLLRLRSKSYDLKDQTGS